MTDSFKSHTRSLTSPPEHAAAIHPDDLEEMSHMSRALYVGDTGDVTVQMGGGGVVTFAGVPGGTMLPIRVTRVLSTGTSASGLVGLW